MNYHSDFNHSATVSSDDVDLIAAMRGLAWASQLSGQTMISSSGTGEKHWRANNHQVKFFFTGASYRDRFVEKARRLFSSGWSLISTKDDEIGAPKGDSYST